ncbi:hypothetical protein J11TS1_37890 [Oceanobacillus sp. J11TS1]|nr:hypothetical protein J11TS1_37890 [Oceanobacillus sp. J11TS1]
MPKSEELEPKPEVYNIYSMDVTYIGDEDIKLDRVEVYRDDPSTSYDIELFTATGDGDLVIEKNSEQPSIGHQNFPISTKATELKVIITWKSESDGSRKYKEEFTFKQ